MCDVPFTASVDSRERLLWINCLIGNGMLRWKRRRAHLSRIDVFGGARNRRTDAVRYADDCAERYPFVAIDLGETIVPRARRDG